VGSGNIHCRQRAVGRRFRAGMFLSRTPRHASRTRRSIAAGLIRMTIDTVVLLDEVSKVFDTGDVETRALLCHCRPFGLRQHRSHDVSWGWRFVLISAEGIRHSNYLARPQLP